MSVPFNEEELASFSACPPGTIRMWPGSPCVPMPSMGSPVFPGAPGGSAAGAAAQGAVNAVGALSPALEGFGFDLLVGVVAAGAMLLGLWLMAGSPQPKAIPVPV